MQPKLDMIGLVVENVPRSVAFYRALGVEVPDFEPGSPYVETTLPNGLRVSWNTVAMTAEIDGHWVEPVGYRMGLAFRCASPAEVDANHDRLTSLGYRSVKAPWDAFWGQRYAQIADPDGNQVDLFAPLES
ncbi:MAG: VOC family protein [Fimbriimonadaceae bacterium]|nr:VOC family protein [Fimbriimonadaceae bacterium]